MWVFSGVQSLASQIPTPYIRIIILSFKNKTWKLQSNRLTLKCDFVLSRRSTYSSIHFIIFSLCSSVEYCSAMSQWGVSLRNDDSIIENFNWIYGAFYDWKQNKNMLFNLHADFFPPKINWLSAFDRMIRIEWKAIIRTHCITMIVTDIFQYLQYFICAKSHLRLLFSILFFSCSFLNSFEMRYETHFPNQ